MMTSWDTRRGTEYIDRVPVRLKEMSRSMKEMENLLREKNDIERKRNDMFADFLDYLRRQ